MADIKLHTFTLIIALMTSLSRADERQCKVKCLPRYVDCNSTNPTLPDLTDEQLELLKQTPTEEYDGIIERIQSSGPIYEGDNVSIPLIEFTAQQERMFRRFYGQGFLQRPRREVIPSRKKRGANTIPCCLPSTSEVRVIIALNEQEELCQVVQLSNIGQYVEDARQCRKNDAAVCNSKCGMTTIHFPVIAVSLFPSPHFQITSVEIGTCTAHSIFAG